VYVFEYLNAKNDSEKLKIIKESVKNVPSDRLLDIHSGAPIPTLAGPAYVYREAFSACGAKGWFIISGVCQSLNAAKWEEAPYIARGLVQSVKNGEITLEQAFKLSESDTWVSREFAKQATENLPELKEIKDDLGTPRIKLSTVLTSILSWGHSDSYAGFIHGLYNIQEEKDKRAAEGNPMSPQEEKNLRDQAALAPVAEVYTAFVLTFAGEIAGPTINPIKSAASRFLSEKAGQVMVKLGATEGESLGTGARQVGQKVVKAIGDAAQGLAQKPKPPSEVVPPETIPPAAEAPKRLKIPKIDLEGFALNVEKFFGVTERNLADDVADTIIQEGLQGNEARLSEAIRQELSTMGYKPQDISKAVERVLKLASQRAAKDLADTESGIFNALVKAGWQGNEPTLESAVDDMLARAQLKPNSSQFASVKNNILDRFRAKAAKIPVKVPVQPAQKPITVQTGGAVSAEPLASHGEVVQDYAVAGTKTATIGDGVSGKPSLGKKSVNAATAGTRQTNAILERSIADGKDAATIAKTVKAQVDALQPQILQTEGGTTLIGAGITSDGKVVIPRVGDGMAGVIRDGQFYHLNNPTNINGKPLFPGQSLPPEFAVGPEMQATGPYNPNQLGIGGNHGFWWGSRVTVNQVQPGDIIVIGSDGILGNVQRPVLTTEQVVKIIQSSKGSAEAASQAIVRQAIATSNNLYHALVDDMSAAVIFVGGK
jgi:serine/threonine protein phosphatase PrpC